MGMFGEIHAEMEAKGLQKVLLEAIKTEDDNIINFCKTHILPLYNSALGESYSMELFDSEENKLITEGYGNECK